MATAAQMFGGEGGAPVPPSGPPHFGDPAGGGGADAGGDVEAGAGAGAAAAGGKKQRKYTPVSKWSTNGMLRVLRLANMCNALAMILVAILIFVTSLVSITFTSVVLSAFIVFFGLLLTCLECNLGNLAPKFRRNFGFMFSFIGRALFIFFCATLLFALGFWLGYIIGSLTAVNAFFNGYIVCVHPAFKSGELSAKGDPYGGYTGGDAVMLSYLQKNPALASRAASAAAAFAAQNPQVAMSVASAASGAGAAGAPAPGGSETAHDGGPGGNPWAT